MESLDPVPSKKLYQSEFEMSHPLKHLLEALTANNPFYNCLDIELQGCQDGMSSISVLAILGAERLAMLRMLPQ